MFEEEEQEEGEEEEVTRELEDWETGSFGSFWGELVHRRRRRRDGSDNIISGPWEAWKCT